MARFRAINNRFGKGEACGRPSFQFEQRRHNSGSSSAAVRRFEMPRLAFAVCMLSSIALCTRPRLCAGFIAPPGGRARRAAAPPIYFPAKHRIVCRPRAASSSAQETSLANATAADSSCSSTSTGSRSARLRAALSPFRGISLVQPLRRRAARRAEATTANGGGARLRWRRPGAPPKAQPSRVRTDPESGLVTRIGIDLTGDGCEGGGYASIR